MVYKKALQLKKKLASGKLSPGIWSVLPSATVCEVIAAAGFDWVIIDAEHSTYNPETLLHILMAFNASDTVPIIRIPSNDDVIIKQVLDMGAGGILVPQVGSIKDVQQAVSACKYPPAGRRGCGPRRASNYFRDLEDYLRCANDAVVCAIQIENVSMAEQIDEVVKIPGLDWVLLGPYDLSGTMGCFGDMDNPELWKTIRKILDAAHAAGLPTGNPLGNAETINKTLELGCQLVTLGDDMSYLKQGIDNALKTFDDVVKNLKK